MKISIQCTPEEWVETLKRISVSTHSVKGEAEPVEAALTAAKSTNRFVVGATPYPYTPSSGEFIPQPPSGAFQQFMENKVKTAAESFWGSSVPGSEVDFAQPDALAELIKVWDFNFGVEGKPQPDRLKALNDAMSTHGGEILRYIRETGGLTRAIENAGCALDSNRARKIAENLTSVASAAGYGEISDMLEYPWRSKTTTKP